MLNTCINVVAAAAGGIGFVAGMLAFMFFIIGSMSHLQGILVDEDKCVNATAKALMVCLICLMIFFVAGLIEFSMEA